MKRIYEPAAYGPQGGCYWADTVAPLHWPALEGDAQADVAVIGGGFTGLSTALHLAQAGVSVALLEAEHPGWGASGRNGGFCCLGGAKASAGMLRRRFGDDGLREWRATEMAAIDTVQDLLEAYAIDVDRHSQGETLLAHSPRAWAAMQDGAAETAALYGVIPTLTPREELRQQGLAGDWFGALTTPLGFALNPRKLHSGLAGAASAAGARLCAHSPVTGLHREGRGWRLDTPSGSVRADKVVLATNGYSSEDLPDWLRARYLPVQSSVIVTRPLTQAEQEAQGWTSAQMAYDSRTLLHYFRLMPNGRFLFGMRGGLRATPQAQEAISRRIRADFARMFPAWAGVEITHEWSGLVCLMAGLTPFVGAVPDHPGLFAGMGFHGNGVAMGCHAGRLLASLVQGRSPDAPYPTAMRAVPRRFPLGRARRALLAPAYLLAGALDL
ncbi:NAD(P)/FAD-dependent oxidoreductase [Thetidibacter halocola]|uniref:FAD-binding oxidoreductase n=1 Tax=Thetidibacter halocola TaxID=2827239 RepID=A0A8J8B9M3_9RHOB|nr:FAD-binding oxidoreductase [Thetidibacter halocola]MBS0125700.1 FAD-binding oxidoreductase [Thetidibacter halocola]